MKKIIETSAWTLWITLNRNLNINVVDTMKKFIDTNINSMNNIGTWKLNINGGNKIEHERC